MPPRKRSSRGRSGAKTRLPVVPDEVLDEAARMFLQNGYYRTRMQDIADSFGVTHAALYYHFHNKQDILAQINTRALRALLEGVKEVKSSDLSPADKLAAAIRRHMAYVADNAAFVATFLEHDLEIPPRKLASITRMRRDYTHVLYELYEDARDAGAVPDVESWVGVSLLLGACNWIYRWYDPLRDLSPKDLVEQGMKFFAPVLSSTAELVPADDVVPSESKRAVS